MLNDIGTVTFSGGAGDDTLFGSTNDDLFVFDGPAFGIDTITDLRNGADRIDLSTFGTSFAAIDDDGDGLLEDGETDGTFTVLIDGPDTLLNHIDGSEIRVANVTDLAEDDILFA